MQPPPRLRAEHLPRPAGGCGRLAGRRLPPGGGGGGSHAASKPLRHRVAGGKGSAWEAGNPGHLQVRGARPLPSRVAGGSRQGDAPRAPPARVVLMVVLRQCAGSQACLPAGGPTLRSVSGRGTSGCRVRMGFGGVRRFESQSGDEPLRALSGFFRPFWTSEVRVGRGRTRVGSSEGSLIPDTQFLGNHPLRHSFTCCGEDRSQHTEHSPRGSNLGGR